MEIKVQISDKAYGRLMSSGSRIQGTIGLVSPTEGNFNEHMRWTPAPGTKYIKLRHGRASVGSERVRLTLNIALDEAGIIPSDAITDESRQASDFVDNALDTFNETFGY